MPITPQQVLHAARLAGVALSPPEVDSLAAELDAILARVEVLRGVDVVGVAPLVHAAERPEALRPDGGLPDAMRTPDTLAPAWLDPFYAVPVLPSHDLPALGAVEKGEE